MRKQQIFDVEELLALPEGVRLVIGFDSEALAGVNSAEPALELRPDIVALGGPRERNRATLRAWFSIFCSKASVLANGPVSIPATRSSTACPAR